MYHSNIIQSTNPYGNNRGITLADPIHNFPLTQFCLNAGRVLIATIPICYVWVTHFSSMHCS